jgi:hypothetical protein
MSSTLPVLISADKELSVVPTWRARGADDLEFSVPLEVIKRIQEVPIPPWEPAML